MQGDYQIIWLVVQEKHAILLPDEFPLDLGALVEPLTVAWYAASRRPIQTTRTVLVVGGAPIGLTMVQVFKARGAESIVVAEVSPLRRVLARKLGAADVVDPLTEDVVSRMRMMAGDAGADIVFECSGVQAGLDTALAGIQVRETATIVSPWEEKPVIDAFDMGLYEKHVIGSVVYDDGIFEAVVDAIWSDPRLMVTSKIRLEEVEDKGFKALINEQDKHVKILVDIPA
ncbi:hypothetical protein EYZ11_006727 [Aspergillus tanneri]|uniref:Alcohol dehydrogenase-like C-terminal domain-containing protein n=1 Tax=Aspergillus tanneri TaxID=1220188 RepID=A0A4S3JKE7_9EURO|nr:hypothetical protein EYZ11_006727 [Aspergillus tanneri]